MSSVTQTPPKAAEKPVERPAETLPEGTIIGRDTRFKSGQIETAYDVIVLGQFEGNITCRKLDIRADASVTGNVTAEMVSVNGGLNGQVHADRIHVLAKANLSGTVFCRHFGSNPEATLAVKVECDPNMQGDKDRPANTSETIPRISGPLPLVDEMAFTLPEPVRVAV